MEQIKHLGPTSNAVRPAARASWALFATSLATALAAGSLTHPTFTTPVEKAPLAPHIGLVTASTPSRGTHGFAISSPINLMEAGDGSAQGAVDWFTARQGDPSYEWNCEKAAENAYGTNGVWLSAIEHWNGAVQHGRAHPGDSDPPLGAFVYWDVAPYGHVGISDGAGGFYSTNINGAIGHLNSLNYTGNYLGWSDPQVPQ